AAVCDVIDIYVKEKVIDTLWTRGRQLEEGLRTIVPPDLAAIEGAPVHQRLRFCDKEKGLQFTKSMLDRGVICHPDCVNIMASHTEAIIDKVLQAVVDSLEDI